MADLLRGKIVLVTGAAMGIGKAIALAAAREGAQLILADLDLAGAKAAAGLIAEPGGPAQAVQVDVADYAAVQRVAAELQGRGLVPDALVNNAATWTIKPFLETEPPDWHRDLQAALVGTLACCRAFLPAFIARGSGAVVNIASDAGRVGEPGWAVYSAAKGGVIAFTKALAKEVGRHGVRVNAVSPGLTRTEKVKTWIPNPEKLAKPYPLGRLGEPEDVAAAVVFLVSDQASFITGQVLSVNGGYCMAD